MLAWLERLAGPKALNMIPLSGMSCFWTNYCGKTLLKFIGEETIHDGGICSSRLQVTVVDVEVLDLDAHEDLVLQFGNVGVADVEVSDVALLLKHARFLKASV